MARERHDERELSALLALLHAPGLGVRRIRELLSEQGTARAVTALAPGELRRRGLGEATVDALRSPDPSRIEPGLAWSRQTASSVLLESDPRYPDRLRELPDAPPALFVVGDPEILALPQVAIVGSRNPSPDGRANALEFAAHLGGRGLVITSGLAEGIDTAGHEGALRAGAPTVAVAGTGPDRVYPAANRELAHRIATEGVLVSEFAPGTPPVAGNFPRRNRIISGLSAGVLVVEAARRSGSLITARFAMEQGREVFAIPGSIHNPLARGCHRLIRDGAKLVETADDILEELASQLRLSAEPDGPSAAPVEAAPELPDEDYRKLLQSMGYGPVSVDELVRRTALTPESVSSMLLLLELQGHVVSAPGGLYRRIPERS
ncbi:MAG TPA: DNA-processing protein DprA [Gammaproteobacteria bacterium]|nr:DNA-processing protein DprA [Gammaproteobacteria bacterium]